LVDPVLIDNYPVGQTNFHALERLGIFNATDCVQTTFLCSTRIGVVG